MKDREIARLREQIEQLQPRKRKKVKRDLNQEFVSFAEIALQRNMEPQQRTIDTQDVIEVAVQVVESESESEWEERSSRYPKRKRPAKVVVLSESEGSSE